MCCVMCCDVLCYVLWCAVLWSVLLFCDILCCVVLCYDVIVLWCVVLWCAGLCYDVIVMCCAMMGYYDVLWTCDVLCCDVVMLWCTVAVSCNVLLVFQRKFLLIDNSRAHICHNLMFKYLNRTGIGLRTANSSCVYHHLTQWPIYSFVIGSLPPFQSCQFSTNHCRLCRRISRVTFRILEAASASLRD